MPEKRAGWLVGAKFRPEGPWELSPGFNLGGRVLSSVRSEGPAEGENVDGIVNGESSWLKKSTNPSICWRASCFSSVLQTGRVIKRGNPG